VGAFGSQFRAGKLLEVRDYMAVFRYGKGNHRAVHALGLGAAFGGLLVVLKTGLRTDF
jgi:hypothetical protein